MDRRRTIQRAYNVEHDITPTSIIKSLEEVRLSTRVADARTEKPAARSEKLVEPDLHDPVRRAAAIAALERQMRDAAANLEYEVAALLRDQILELRAIGMPGAPRPESRPRQRPARRRV